MIRTRVGYAGGTTPEPTYRAMGDHTETIEIDYDPKVISYEQLLDVFWSNHDPSQARSRQYMSAVFYNDEDQRVRALRSMGRFAKRSGKVLRTVIKPVNSFTRAEDYHQKYRLKRDAELTRALVALYPEPTQLVDSTLATRANAIVSGNHDAAEIIVSLKASGAPMSVLELLANRAGVQLPARSIRAP